MAELVFVHGIAWGRAGVASRVVGEIYEVEEAQLEVLDAFEGCPDLYARERVAVVIGKREVEAWTYVLAGEAPSHASIVTTGRYAGGGVVLQVNAKEAEKHALEGAMERDALDKRR